MTKQRRIFQIELHIEGAGIFREQPEVYWYMGNGRRGSKLNWSEIAGP